MEAHTKKKVINIGGMTCANCENLIEKKLSKIAGIKSADVNFNKGTAIVIYDTDIISYKDICHIIENLGYEILPDSDKEESGNKSFFGVIVILFAVYFFMNRLGILSIFNFFPEAEVGMENGMLFIIGLLTSVHCVAMCGGINLSQCIPKSNKSNSKSIVGTLTPSILYNLGRVTSYTLIGGIVGAAGSVISFSGSAKGIVQIIAGLFMVIMGLNMLNIFPELRKFNPRMPKIIAKKIGVMTKGNNPSGKYPFYVGLLNGLMPCGPLQAMQLYALSTGSFTKGAFSMFLFSLGTVPLMFSLGALSSLLSKKFTSKVMSVGAVVVVILGISMFSSGMNLSGFGMFTVSTNQENKVEAKLQDGIQVVNTNLSPGQYTPIEVKAGIPVKWIINAKQGTVNGCNNRIIIPKYGIEKKLTIGENVIEFTPTKEEEIVYSCWMGMIRSSITVE